MIDLYTIRVDAEQAFALNARLMEYVSEQRKLSANRFKKAIDAHRSIIGELIARIAICRSLQVANHALAFGRNAYNKPLLVHPPGYHYNISHAGDWVVCAFGNQPVGIDVEFMKPIAFDIAGRFFSAQEFDRLNRLEESEKLTYFYRIWTLKESYVKAVGKGLSIPLDSFSVRLEGEAYGHASLEAGEPHAYFQPFVLDERHAMALCTFSEATIRIHRLDYEGLIGHLPLLEGNGSRASRQS